MSLLFTIFLSFLIPFLPLHFLSVSHQYLEKKGGVKKGMKYGSILGMISGWGFFICLFGLWFSPQPSFILPILNHLIVIIPFINYPIPFFHLLIAAPIILISAWLGIAGVRATSLKVSETHRTNKIVTRGLYSKIRHPQYFGAILSHIGFSILLSALYSLFVSPIIFIYSYITSWKEEKELIKEFGEEYVNYMDETYMFIPKII